MTDKKPSSTPPKKTAPVSRPTRPEPRQVITEVAPKKYLQRKVDKNNNGGE